MQRLSLVGRFRNVGIYIHWSTFVVVAVVILGGFSHVSAAIFGVFCFGGVMLFHEVGHAFMAHRVGTRVLSINLYPVHGCTTYELPWSRLDDCRIAWGGCLAQLALAIPFIGYLQRFGYPKNDTAAVILGLLGPVNLAIAVFNMLPISGLDGGKAWYLIPLSIQAWWKRRGTKRRVEFRRPR